MPGTIKLSIDADISQFNQKMQELIRNTQQEVDRLNQRLTISAAPGASAAGVGMADQKGNIIGGPGPAGATSAYQSVVASSVQRPAVTAASVKDLQSSFDYLKDVLKNLSSELSHYEGELHKGTEADKKRTQATIDVIKSEQSRAAANKKIIEETLGGGGGGTPNMGMIGGIGGLVASALQMPGVALTSRGAMGAITGRNVAALASTEYEDAIRRRAEFTDPAKDAAAMSTVGKILALTIAGAVGGSIIPGVGTLVGAIGGGAMGLIGGLAGAGSMYAGSYESNLISMAKARGADPIQYSAARNWAMGPGLHAGRSMWGTGGTEASIMGLFDMGGTWQGRSMEEAAGGITGALGFGGRAIAGNRGRLGSKGGGINWLANALAISPNAAAGVLSSFGGITGQGGNAAQDQNVVFNELSRAITQGMDNAQTLNKMVTIMQSGGGGLGSEWLANVAKSSIRAFGERGDENVKAAQTFSSMQDNMMRSTGGFFGASNWMAISALTGKSRGSLKPGASVNELMLQVAGAGMGDLAAMGGKNPLLNKYFKTTAGRDAFLRQLPRQEMASWVMRSMLQGSPEVAQHLLEGKTLGDEEMSTLQVAMRNVSGVNPTQMIEYLAVAGGKDVFGFKPGRHGLGKGGYDPSKMPDDPLSGFKAITTENISNLANLAAGTKIWIDILGTSSDSVKNLRALTDELIRILALGDKAKAGDYDKAQKALTEGIKTAAKPVVTQAGTHRQLTPDDATHLRGTRLY